MSLIKAKSNLIFIMITEGKIKTRTCGQVKKEGEGNENIRPVRGGSPLWANDGRTA